MTVLVELRQRFWFLPAVMCVLAVLVAEALIAVDRAVGTPTVSGWADHLVLTVGESGSRDVLGAIATSSLAVAGTTFSITIAVLALTSSAYGPRLVPGFMADRGNQAVLGVFVSTFLYALLVLRSIRAIGDPGDQEADVFVPHLAVNFAVLLAVANVAVLVWFIHHISDSIQVWTLASQVRETLCRTIERLYPERAGESRPVPAGAIPTSATGVVVTAQRPGYVELVDIERLVRLASRHDAVVALTVTPGDHVVAGEAVAVVGGLPAERVGEVVERVRRAVHVADARDAHQDVAFVVQQLTDMAARALSPGTNDPTTAVNAVDDLAAGLTLLAERPLPSAARFDDEGALRLYAPHPDPVDLVGSVLEAIRWYGAGAPTVVRAAVRLAARVGAAARDPALRAAAAEEVELLAQAVARADLLPADVDRLTTEAREVTDALRA
ncbi:DUF2254 domain-containing protein [Cellulomonas sp. DKR-3]|uniref:DUF2254 domain-containing protein n=1 Tax=Cellulomonas fulva TaxID=2835530 RepID=A0ABS5TV35_9CELL|nr:DUF2254 domain-containing protein [Cellulomonas fulva]MBT0992962.1 DUF2254 domain-containing protein [Cellulomonas fulva]